MIQNVSQFRMYATIITTNQSYLEEGDNDHIKTIVDVQHNVQTFVVKENQTTIHGTITIT